LYKESIEILRAAALAKGHIKRVGQEMVMHMNSKFEIYGGTIVIIKARYISEEQVKLK
jgi:hypothetical protein